MSKKILLVDDSVTIQKVVSITFTSEDFDLSTVSDGVSAISKAREICPDLILLDISMPEKNGYQVCEEIKQDPELRDIPILMLAGTFEPYDEGEGKRVGADDHIVKPFESQELVDKVKAMLNGQETMEPSEDKAVSEEEDMWDVSDIGDFMEVEKEAITPEEGVGEAVGFSMEGAEGLSQPLEEESIGEAAKEDVDKIEEAAPAEEDVMTPSGSIEEVVGFSDEEEVGESFPPLEEEGIGEVSKEEVEEDKAVEVGEEDLEFIEDVEPLEEIEPLEIEEEQSEELTEDKLSVQAEGEGAAHEEVIEKPIFEESAPEETPGEEIEFGDIVSEDTGIGEDEDEVETSTEAISEPLSSEEISDEETMFKEDISEEIGSEDVMAEDIGEKEAPDIAIEEAIHVPEKVVHEEALREETMIESSKIDEILEEKIKEKIEECVTSERIEEVLNKVVKDVVEDVTWEVAPGLIEDIVKAEVKRVKEAIVKE